MKEGTSEELADFLRFCASERRLAPLTCSAYERDVSACLDYLQGQGIEDVAEVKVTHLRAFLAEEQKRRPAVSSQARTTAALKSFFRFLVEEERLVRDPALPLRTPMKHEVLPDVLTMCELERLLVQSGRHELWERHFPGKPERDRLLLALMAYGGLRRSELLGLEWDDVDLSRRLLRVRKAKGGRQRTIPIHAALEPLFAEYYATRVPLTEQAVFVGVQGKPLNYTQLGQVFRHYVDAAGVNERKRVTPHTLRHVFASELLHAGANLRQIQELLGHKHLDSTQRYTRVNAHELSRRDQAAALSRLISPLRAASRLESSELACKSAAMAKRKAKARVPATKSAPVVPLPDPRSMESALAAIGRGAAHYASDEALFEAQDLMYEAFDARGTRRAALAREALAISPDCADAYLLLAEETASSLEEARELLEQGVAAGERALGAEPFEEDVGYFWGILETRPYMRARAALAETLWALDRREEVVEHQRELLRLNPNDNQGVRYRQAEWLLWLERYEELDELFAAYEDDAAAAFAFTRALATFRREGDSADARRLLEEARELNPHVPAYLSGRKKLPKRLPDYVGFGDESEAVDYAYGAAASWALVPGALAWLEP